MSEKNIEASLRDNLDTTLRALREAREKTRATDKAYRSARRTETTLHDQARALYRAVLLITGAGLDSTAMQDTHTNRAIDAAIAKQEKSA